MNTTIGSSLGIPIKPHMKVIDDLHYKYLFFLSSLDANNLTGMEEEEKRLFAYIITYKDYMFSLDKPSEELRDFHKYTVQLSQSVVDNYLSIFEDKNLDIKDFVNDKIISSFKSLQTSLVDIVNTKQSLHYITCVLVCTALLFLVRTTKRSLFMYISQKHSNATRNAAKVKAVVGIEPVDMNIRDKLASTILYVADYITSVQSLIVKEILKTAKTIDQMNELLPRVNEARKNAEEYRALLESMKQTNNQLDVELKKSKQDCSAEVEALKKELAEQKANMQKLQSDEGKKQMLEQLASRTRELKNNLAGIVQLANNFDKLFKRWDTNITDRDIVAMKMDALNELNGPSHEDNNMYQTGVSLLSEKVDISPPAFDGNLHAHTNNIIVLLVNALIQLGRDQVIKNPDGLEMFYGGSQIYNKLVLLYEELSGAVRAVVRVRDVYTTAMKGGRSKKRKMVEAYSSSNTPKRRKLYSYKHGGSGEDTRFINYEVRLDKKNKLVQFVGIDPNEKAFQGKTLQHGPFFSVHNNQLNDPTATSIEDDLLKGIGFDTLVNMFEGIPQKGKEPAIVMYTYGYSGSGKSYTLFGEKTLNSQELPKAGVMWEIVRRLQNSYDLKLESTTICYGYLEFNNNGYVFKTNDIMPSTKNLTNVKQWANAINKDFSDALRVVNADSFIKVTPNNPESSRGFYIVKVGVYEKNSNYKNVKGYIGVVDMAGNEDPFDIAATICPTMKFAEMNTLLSHPEQINQYDIVYEKLQNTLVEILGPTIMKALYKKYKGIYSNSFDKVINVNTLASLESKKYPLLVALRDDLPIALSSKTSDTDGKKPIYIDMTDKDGKLAFSYNQRMKGNKSTTKVEFMKIGKDADFTITNGLLLEVCMRIAEENEPYVPDALKNVEVTVNDIRRAILEGKSQMDIDILKIKHAMSRLVMSLQSNNLTKPYASIMFPLSDDVRNIMRTTSPENGLAPVESAIKSALTNLSNKPYLLSFMSNGNVIEYTYKTIARIIQEGYYINKANAELMDYFKKKLHMQDVSKIVTVKKGYNFDASFAFSSYKKFSKDFVPIVTNSANANANISQKDFQYDTGLVSIIKQQFPGKNKDIIFACVRNDKDFGKILGAIDTLELIRDLKST